MRSYLAVGPWVKNGENMALRVVLYKKRGELVVHTQGFSRDSGVEFANGGYFRLDEHEDAIAQWKTRNDNMMLYTLAPAELATEATTADLDSQLVPA